MNKKMRDEKLTAYALGELTKDEELLMEKALAESPELREELEALQKMAFFLESELQREPLPDSHSGEFFKKLESADQVPLSWWIRLKWPVLGSLVMGALALMMFVQINSPSDEDFKATVVSNKSPEFFNPPLEMDKEPKAKEYAGKGKLIGMADSATGAVRGGAPQRLAKKVRMKSKRVNVDMGGRGERFRAYPRPFYGQVYKNSFLDAKSNPLSTFSIDVDTASYSIVRRSLMEYNQFPSPDAVRIEEMINYFDYQDSGPRKQNEPFSVKWEVADSPWIKTNTLVRIAIHGKVPLVKEQKDSNLVFLVDVSGSMESADKLPLLKKGLHKLVDGLGQRDRISLVVYAGDSRVVLESTLASSKNKIHKAIDDLTASGGTNGSGGISKAYELASQGFVKGGNNRVILATDGDFNLGVTSPGALDQLIVEKAKSGVYLTVLGFGNAYHSDRMMESLSNKGNGNYYIIDSEKEAEKVLVKGIQGTLVTIAKDVKIQVEFNPENVVSYRLIGYENRKLEAQDFNDDKKDAGDIGAGHTVVALYEVTTKDRWKEGTDPLKYQKQEARNPNPSKFKDQLMTLKLRYKDPAGDRSVKREFVLQNTSVEFQKASDDMRWSVGVAGFGMMLKNSEKKGDLTYGKVIQILDESRWKGRQGYNSQRGELVEMVKKAKALSREDSEPGR